MEHRIYVWGITGEEAHIKCLWVSGEGKVQELKAKSL
jgi:hypothetical protein